MKRKKQIPAGKPTDVAALLSAFVPIGATAEIPIEVDGKIYNVLGRSIQYKRVADSNIPLLILPEEMYEEVEVVKGRFKVVPRPAEGRFHSAMVRLVREGQEFLTHYMYNGVLKNVVHWCLPLSKV